MTLTRREAGLATLAAGLGLGSARAQQAWPARQLTLVVPFAPGGGTDAFARPLAAQLDAQLGVRVLIENKAGAGGTVGASFAAKAAPDGHTFFVGAAHHAIAPALYKTLDYDLKKDFIAIGMVSAPPQVIVANPRKVQANTLAELLAFARANPGKLNYGSAGNGTTHHLTGELFKLQTGVDIAHIPYRGAGPALADLVGGQIDLMFDGLGSSAPQIQGGALKGIALAAPKRSAAIPNVPTTAEAGLPGFEVATWYALFAPKGTPAPIIERISSELRKALASAPIQESWAKNGSDIPTLMGADFARFVNSEIARWGKVVADAKVTA
jgi:tripartite-type tricarboxylate transporter receptor subunit TctC